MKGLALFLLDREGRTPHREARTPHRARCRTHNNSQSGNSRYGAPYQACQPFAIRSIFTYSLSTSGTTTEPSGCW